MSMERCKTCNTNVDTDYNAEHFPCENDEIEELIQEIVEDSRSRNADEFEILRIQLNMLVVMAEKRQILRQLNK